MGPEGGCSTQYLYKWGGSYNGSSAAHAIRQWKTSTSSETVLRKHSCVLLLRSTEQKIVWNSECKGTIVVSHLRSFAILNLPTNLLLFARTIWHDPHLTQLNPNVGNWSIASLQSALILTSVHSSQNTKFSEKTTKWSNHECELCFSFHCAWRLNTSAGRKIFKNSRGNPSQQDNSDSSRSGPSKDTTNTPCWAQEPVSCIAVALNFLQGARRSKNRFQSFVRCTILQVPCVVSDMLWFKPIITNIMKALSEGTSPVCNLSQVLAIGRTCTGGFVSCASFSTYSSHNFKQTRHPSILLWTQDWISSKMGSRCQVLTPSTSKGVFLRLQFTSPLLIGRKKLCALRGKTGWKVHIPPFAKLFQRILTVFVRIYV